MVASQLQAQASLESLSTEELSQKLLAEAVQKRARYAITEAANRWRVELVRKSDRGTLSGAEAAELDRLQTQLDERLERWDQELLAELGRMEKAVDDLPAHGKWAGYPDGLPQLFRLRLPGGNRRPEGIAESYAQRQSRDELPDIYWTRNMAHDP